MAGERFRFPGYTELSGVCTHPDFRGRGLARRLSATVAEGIEDEATLQALIEMGADYAQGYWIGRPAPLDELWTPTAGMEQT